MMITPMKPTTSPTTPLTLIGPSGRKSAESTIANNGTGDVRIAASEDSMDRSAHVMSRNEILLMIAHHEEMAVDPPVARQGPPGKTG